MKIHANGFYVDMNALLNQLNGHYINGYYNKIISSNAKNFSKIENHMNYQIQHEHNDSTQLAGDLKNIIDNNQRTNQNMWNYAIPKKIRDAMDATLQQVPTSTVYYYPPGQRPDNPQPGDIVWHLPQPTELGSNTVRATAEEYYRDGDWRPIKGATQDVFGANIFGANIKGGEITGAEFRSNELDNRGRSAFSVDAEGNVFALNFQADLEHEVHGGQVNPINYHGYVDSGEGFNLQNGILGMTAFAEQLNGRKSSFIWSDHPSMQAGTLMEPGYLKLRYDRGKDSNGNDNFVRTDLRAGNLEIAGNTWNDDKDIRLGYWDSTGPQIALGSWNLHEGDNKSKQESKGNADLQLYGPGNIQIHQPLMADNGIQTNSLIVHGGFQVDGKTLADSSDIASLVGRISSNESNIDTNKTNISNQGQVLDGNSSYDEANIINGYLNGNNHEGRLNAHNSHLSSHDSKIQDLYNQLSDKLSIHQSGGETVVDLDGNSMFTVGDCFLTTDGEADCNRLFLDDVMITLSGSRNSIKVDDTTLATYEWVKDNFKKTSRLSIKRDIHDVDPKAALSEVLNTDIKGWNYKKDSPNEKVHYGPIIDDLHSRSNEKYYTPAPLLTNDEDQGIDVADSVSFLFLSIQELEKQNSHLTQRVAKLEFDKGK